MADTCVFSPRTGRHFWRDIPWPWVNMNIEECGWCGQRREKS